MTPDRSTVWERQEIPSSRGALVLSPDCPEDLAASVLHASDPCTAMGRPLGRGREGSVYPHDPGTVLKVFQTGSIPTVAAIYATLKFNLALYIGLQSMTATEQAELQARSRGAPDTLAADERQRLKLPPPPPICDFSAPRMLAGFIPAELGYATADPVAVFAMSREAGVTADNYPQSIPSTFTRCQVYRVALKSVGIDPTHVELDDLALQNTLVRRAEGGHQRPMITKLDIRLGPAYVPRSY